jgi:hypothetical protein
MNISTNYPPSLVKFPGPGKAARPTSETSEPEQPKESWNPLTLGSSLGAVFGAGITANSFGSGATAGLVGFGTAYAAGKLLKVDRYDDVGLLLFGTMVAATAAAATAAGPVGVALLAGGGILAHSLSKEFAQ